MDQHITDNSSQQAFYRHCVQPAHMPRQQSQKRGNENHQPDSAQALGQRRLNLARSKPADSEQSGKDRQQKRADTEELQSQIRNKCPNHADPVAGDVGSGQHGSAIERRIERRIRSQSEEEEERRDAQQESDQLIQPPVARGDKDACQKTHEGRFPPDKYVLWRNRPERNHYYKNETGRQWRNWGGVLS